MIRKIVKYFIIFIVSLLGLLLFVMLLLHLPPVQNFVKNKAVDIVTQSTGMDLSIERMRFRLPLRLVLDNTTLVTSQGDTLVSAAEIRAGLRLFPLLRSELKVRRLGIKNAAVHYRDTLSAIDLRATVEELLLRGTDVGLKRNSVDIRSTDLTGAIVRLTTGQAVEVPDTAVKDTVRWKIFAGQLNLRRINFDMDASSGAMLLSASLPEGVLKECAVDLFAQSVEARLLHLKEGSYNILSDTTGKVPQPLVTADSIATEQVVSVPWTISLARFVTDNNSFQYTSSTGEPVSGFDPGHISLSSLEIMIDSAYNRGSDISAVIGSLAFEERSGIKVEDLRGRLAMDSTGISIDGLNLQTARSNIQIDARAGSGITEMLPETPVSLKLGSSIHTDDIFIFYNAQQNVRATLADQYLSVNADTEGTVGELDINSLMVELPRRILFNADGVLRSVTSPDKINGNIRFDGTFRDIGFIKLMIPDTTTRNRIGFPSNMSMQGRAAIDGKVYSPELALLADSGRIDLKGRIDLGAETYDASMKANDFPLYKFLPSDSLGYATLSLYAEGHSFDPRKDGASADISLTVERFDYRSYPHTGLSLDALLADHKVTGTLASTSQAARFDFDLTGIISQQEYTGRLAGRIDTLDLQQMHLSATPLAAGIVLDVNASLRSDSTFSVDAALDSVRIAYGEQRQFIRSATIEADANRGQVWGNIKSGDFVLALFSPEGIDSLLAKAGTTTTELQRQLAGRSIDMQRLQDAMPSIKVDMSAGRNNILRSLALSRNLDFSRLILSASATDELPLSAGIVINGFSTGGITLDTLNIGLRRQDDRLNYAVRLRNRPGNIEQMALIRVMGNISGNTAVANFYQRNRRDSVGFEFGLTAQLLDSAVRVSMSPENPLFGYRRWSVNDGNYLTYDFKNGISADFRLDGGNSRFHISTASPQQMPRGAVKLEMAGIDIGEVLGMLPAPPPASGYLASDIIVGLNSGIMIADGRLDVTDMMWDKRRVGNIGAQVDFRSDSLRQQLNNAIVSVDNQTVLTANGTYISEKALATVIEQRRASGEFRGRRGSAEADSTQASSTPRQLPTGARIDFDAEITTFPLQTANAFLPADMLQLAGSAKGKLTIRGRPSSPTINGSVGFSGGQLTVPMIGTSFGISEREISVARNRLDFNDFSLTAPNGQPLTLDGIIDASDFSRIVADMELYTVNFAAVSSTRQGGSQVYGRANIDADINAKGPLDALAVRGDVTILSTTDVYYTMQESALNAESQRQDIVTFVSFADSAALAGIDSLHRVRTSGMDALVNVNIVDGVEACINLDNGGENRIELIGEGSLTYTMNSQGDSRFTGRYDLSGGTVVYSPPVISQKNFAVQGGSYVEWTGDMVNPSFNITATEKLPATVTMDDGSTGSVTFDITVYVTNTLENMALVFDLSAPNDLTIQNQLASLSPEQRSQQAIGLLIYNTYTGPGATATAGGGGVEQQLGSYISRELNKWARNSLNGVDLSVGVQNVTDASGGTHTDYSYSVSKSLLDDRIKVTVGGSINSGEDAGDNLKDNFVDDISLEYRLTERDNMFLKVYRYNTQESILEGEITETGFGFVLRKRMNKLGELFRLIPPPEKREQNRQQREMRREIRNRELQREDDPEGNNTPGGRRNRRPENPAETTPAQQTPADDEDQE